MVTYETRLKIEYEDVIGDTFVEGEDGETVKALIEQHILDYCKEHKIERSDVKVIED